MEQDCSQWTCNMCGNVGMADGSDGYFYCQRCGSQADNIIDTGVADEDFVDKGTQGGAIYLSSHTRHSHNPVLVQPISQFEPQSQQFWSQFSQEHGVLNDNQDAVEGDAGLDGMGPTDMSDFGPNSSVCYSHEDYYKELRNRYLMGLQMMIQAQCEALVEKFNVKPLICGIVGSIWLRFVASTGVFNDGWADEAIYQSEVQKSGEVEDFKPHARYREEPHNIHGQRAVIIWLKYLRKRIPLYCSLAVSFLGCHVAREAVLPTDIIKWSVEGELTYLDAFVEIEKRIGRPLPTFPLTLRTMFRPKHAIPAKKLESQAAIIAQCVGLNLPPLNFYAIASRYLRELSLPAEKILPHSCKIYEWMLPSELRLSANDYGLPTCVYVMSILVIAIRIVYNVNGFGVWEKCFSCHNPPDKSNEAVSKNTTSFKVSDKSENGFASRHESKLDATELLCNLEARYNEINYKDDDVKHISKSMPTYLQFCQDVVFAGSELPMDFYHEEKGLIDKFWDFYQKKGCEPGEDVEELYKSVEVNKKARNDEDLSYHIHTDVEHSSSTSEEHENKETSDSVSAENLTTKEKAIRLMKRNMEVNKFLYIPPRVRVKRLDYLHYVRKKDKGAMTYAAHVDYYILLRSCASVAEVDMRVMHVGVLSMERKLAWLEKRIDHCLHLRPPSDTCKFCTDDTEQAADDASIGLSDLNL